MHRRLCRQVERTICLCNFSSFLSHAVHTETSVVSLCGYGLIFWYAYAGIVPAVCLLRVLNTGWLAYSSCIIISSSITCTRYSSCPYEYSNMNIRFHLVCSILPYRSVREYVCNNSKNVKSHVFWILKNKRTYSFTGHLITQPLIHNYQKSVAVSHQHQTSFSEMWTQENAT